MNNLTALPSDSAVTSSAEFRVGVGSAPYLADHGFQDLVVLPGSYYIDTALQLYRDRFKRNPASVSNVTFHNPILLSAEDIAVTVEMTDLGDGRVGYAFYETGGEAGGNRQYAAKMEISASAATTAGRSADELSIETFRARSDVSMDAKRFYERVRQNGNQYGPKFQNIVSIWRAGGQSLGRLSIGAWNAASGQHYIHPSVLDAMTQLLAPFIVDKGKTFILRSIEKINLLDAKLPDSLWAHAELRLDSRDNETSATVRAFDESGKLYMELVGVTFSLLDQAEAASEKPLLNLVVASNFTAEPLEDSLNFWGDHFGVQLKTEFAPYNQVFQQLLDPASAFRRNTAGVNAVLLGLEEWTAGLRRAPMELDKDRAEKSFGNRARYTLANGLDIVHLNRYETEYVYDEIFEDQCYLRHGIELNDRDTVIDIGANIGLFSLFAMSRCKNGAIYACEPAPVVYDLLKANCDAYGSNVHALNVGVSDKRKTATFTFYEKSSVFSGFHSNENVDRDAIRAVVRNMLHESVAEESVEEYIDELTADRLRGIDFECQLVSVSDIIREHGIERIDLLKVDAEKSELAIIDGIADHDWPKIKQIVMEIHDPTREAITRIEQLLIQKGFHCALEQETLLEHAGLFNLYATRGEIKSSSAVTSAKNAGAAKPSTGNLTRNVREFADALRAFSSQVSTPTILCFTPRTPAAGASAELSAALDSAESDLAKEAAGIANVRIIRSEALLRNYPLVDYYDSHSHATGHIPYTPECYAAIGTAVVRTLYGIKRNPFKVIVLDCDNTLWKGVVGEDGPLGVEIAPGHRELQQFMIAQMNAGMLLTLCSKNNEKDALDVFDKRSDMALKRENLVAWRINWNSKSENIRALAKQLNLGLDSFIFIDDNPVECAEVRANCPDVLTLQLPQDPARFGAFLNHVWAFDHLVTTEEDRNRTKMYREGAERQQHREQSVSLKDFLKGLQLRIDIANATEQQLPRVSQLTQRTNQFNFTTVRRSESEIRDLLRRPDAKCLAVSVTDRFGDYGLVGVVIYIVLADRYTVDTMLLSCRVLGRGVEHALMARLGQLAVADGKKFVEVSYVPTEKNTPALEFISDVGKAYRNGTDNRWTFPSEQLAKLSYEPAENVPVGEEVRESSGSEKARRRTSVAFGVEGRSERLQHIGTALYSVETLGKAIEAFRLGSDADSSVMDTPTGNTLETAVVNIWRRVLGRTRIGLDDNFFEVGGTSLRAVQVVAAIKKDLKRAVSIVNLFECPTVRLLVAKLDESTTEAPASGAESTAASRGQQRRYNTMRRKTS